MSFVFYFFCSFTREFLCYVHLIEGIKPIADERTRQMYYTIFFPSLTTANVVTVIVSSLVTVYWLRNRNEFGDTNTKSSRKATVTVLILSLMYSVMNALFVSGAVISFCVRQNIIESSGTLWAFREIVLGSAQGINSSANPIIYIVRKKEMRRFALDVGRIVKAKMISESNINNRASFNGCEPAPVQISLPNPNITVRSPQRNNNYEK